MDHVRWSACRPAAIGRDLAAFRLVARRIRRKCWTTRRSRVRSGRRVTCQTVRLWDALVRERTYGQGKSHIERRHPTPISGESGLHPIQHSANAPEAGARIDFEWLAWFGQFEDFLERVETLHDIRLASTKARGDVLDRFGREDHSA